MRRYLVFPGRTWLKPLSVTLTHSRRYGEITARIVHARPLRASALSAMYAILRAMGPAMAARPVARVN